MVLETTDKTKSAKMTPKEDAEGQDLGNARGPDHGRDAGRGHVTVRDARDAIDNSFRIHKIIEIGTLFLTLEFKLLFFAFSDGKESRG